MRCPRSRIAVEMLYVADHKRRRLMKHAEVRCQPWPSTWSLVRETHEMRAVLGEIQIAIAIRDLCVASFVHLTMV